MTHPPDPQMQRAARQGDPSYIPNHQPEQNCTSLADIQAGRLSRLYALTLSTASTIAALAFGVVR